MTFLMTANLQICTTLLVLQFALQIIAKVSLKCIANIDLNCKNLETKQYMCNLLFNPLDSRLIVIGGKWHKFICRCCLCSCEGKCKVCVYVGEFLILCCFQCFVQWRIWGIFTFSLQCLANGCSCFPLSFAVALLLASLQRRRRQKLN